MTGKHLEIVSHNVLWYKHSFRMDCVCVCVLCVFLTLFNAAA